MNQTDQQKQYRASGFIIPPGHTLREWDVLDIFGQINVVVWLEDLPGLGDEPGTWNLYSQKGFLELTGENLFGAKFLGCCDQLPAEKTAFIEDRSLWDFD